MRFVKRNWKTILSAVIVLLVIAAAIAGTSIHSVKDEQKRAMEALQPVEIGEEQILSEEEAATETAEAEQQKEEQKEQAKQKNTCRNRRHRSKRKPDVSAYILHALFYAIPECTNLHGPIHPFSRHLPDVPCSG